MIKFIQYLTFILLFIQTILSLDSPQFWNLAKLNIEQQQFNLYYGWDATQTFVYFRIQGTNQGWIALGFGSNLSQMDMIVLRLNQLRVVAEDRFSISDSQAPTLNTKVKDTFLIMGQRNAAGYWDVTFKRRASSVDPKKVLLDTSQRYITILLGQGNDEEFVQLSRFKQIFKISFNLSKICHQTCAVNQCTGPSSQECTGCDYFRVLYRNTCILRQPQIFNEIVIPPIFNANSRLFYGFSSDNQYIYFQLKQDTWKVWMGLMFNNSQTDYTDFYVAYKTSQSQFLVSDYFVNAVSNEIIEDEVQGDGSNDAFITDSQDNSVTIVRQVDTGSQYDVVLNQDKIVDSKFNFTLLLGSKDFFESEIQPYQNQQKITINKIACDSTCISCYFNSEQSSCSACNGNIPLYGSIFSCQSGPTQPTIPSSEMFTFILKNQLDSIQISNSNKYMKLSVNLRRFQNVASQNINNPRLNNNIDYYAVSFNMNNDYVIFLMCSDKNDISQGINSLQYKNISNTFVRQQVQNILVIPGGKCQNGILNADISLKSYATNSPFILSLHVDCYDLKQLVLYSSKTSLNLSPTLPIYCKQTQALFPSFCTQCNQDTSKLPFCCQGDTILQQCQKITINYWNKIDLKSNDVQVSYSISNSIIYFKYKIITDKQDGAFGCGFNKDSINTDMMIFQFKNMVVGDYYSHGEIIPELDQVQNIVTISVTQLQNPAGFEAVFARNLSTDPTTSSQDQDLTSYKGPLICYLGSDSDLSPNNRQAFFNSEIQFSAQKVCDTSCSDCALKDSQTSCSSNCIQGYAPKNTVCTTCIKDYQKQNPETDICLPTCNNQVCTQCQTPDICLCNSGYFLYYGSCLPIVPELVYINNFQISFNNLGFTLLYGFDAAQKYIYLNIQGSNQGYISLGFGSHSTFMDIIMIQNSISNKPQVTDMFSQKEIFCAADTQSHVAYLSGGYNNGFWNITVFRPILSTDPKDLSLSLTDNNQVSLVLGSDQSIGYHKASQTIQSQFYYAKAQGGQVNYTNTYIPEKPLLYNKIDFPQFNTSLYYGFDKNSQFIYFKVVGMLHLKWFGIGFGNSMTSTDMIIIRYVKQSQSSGKQGFFVDDRFSDGQSMPGLDIQQDVIMIKSTNIDQLTSSANSTVEFVRKLISADPYSEDFNITFNTKTSQTNPIDLVFAQGVDSDFTSAGHSSHILMRNVILSGIQDCSQCTTQKCTGPDLADCSSSNDVSISVYSRILEIALTLLVISLLI